MKLTTRKDLVLGIVDRWAEQYPPALMVKRRDGFGVEMVSKLDRLKALDLETATPEDINAVIGNASWTRIICDECQQEVEAVVMVGEEPDYESHTAGICRPCLGKALALMDGR